MKEAPCELARFHRSSLGIQAQYLLFLNRDGGRAGSKPEGAEDREARRIHNDGRKIKCEQSRSVKESQS